MTRSAWAVLLSVFATLGVGACSDDARHDGAPDGGDSDTDGDTDSDTDTDTDSDSDSDEWCPELSTSCGAPTTLESCGYDTLDAPRLIAPLSGKYVRDRRPEIIWDGAASGVSQYRLEIARDRAFTDVVYRSTTYEGYPGIDNRFRHIVSCDLDCGVHFFRVMSVTSPECELGTPTYVWEMYVGMAPNDLDRDGVPDIMCWHVEPAGGEFENDKIQGYAIFDLDEKGGQTLSPTDLDLIVEFEMESSAGGYYLNVFEYGDINGDNAIDIALSLTSADDISQVATHYFFSISNRDDLLNDDDAIVVISDVQGHEQLYLVHQRGTNFAFRDFNGDGKSDILFASNSIPSSISYLVFGEPEVVDNSVAEADVTFTVDDDYILGWNTSSDLNGDGFADLVGVFADVVDTGNWNHLFYQFGAESTSEALIVPGDVPVVSEPDAGITVDGWATGTSFDFNANGVLGDVDFDGYPEVGLWVDVFNLPVLDISTGGFIVLDEKVDSSTESFADVLDFLVIGDFSLGLDQTDTEMLQGNSPSGDINGDGIDDLCLFSVLAGDEDYQGTDFCFWGRNNWSSYYLSSEADYLDLIGIEEPGQTFYISDIDGDGTAEPYRGDTIVLSASGDTIVLSNTLVGEYCQYGYGIVMPYQNM